MKVIEKAEVITERKRSEVNAYKVSVLNDLLKVIAEEDVDAVLLAVLTAVKNRGYKLQAEPEALIETINAQFA